MLSVRARRLILLLAALTALLLTGCAAVTTPSGPSGVGAQNRVWAFTPAAQLLAPPTRSQSSCSHPGLIASAVGLASGFCVAAKEGAGGLAPVLTGQAGEAAVRAAYDIGPKATRVIDGRTRIFDGLTGTAVSEVKNVSYQAYTQQLKDSLAYAQQTGRQFDLYVRGGANPTTLSGPLRDAMAGNPAFNLEFIP